MCLNILFLTSCNEEEKVKILSDKKSYIILNDYNFDISLYIKEDYQFYLNDQYINKMYIKDSKDQYELSLNNTTKEDGVIKYNNEEYRQYNLNVNFNYDFEHIFKIPSVNLYIEYENNQKVNINIGSFTFLKIQENEKIYISGYKGIINDVISMNDLYYPSIVGMIVTITNSTNNNVIIKNITPINGHLEIEQDKIQTINEINIDNEININELLDNKYNLIYQENNNNLNLQINQNKINLLIPISYTSLMMTNNISLLIEYEINSITYYEYLSNIILFSSSKLNNNFNSYVIN